MTSRAEHEAEQAAITAAHKDPQTPCERAQEVMDEADKLINVGPDYPNSRRAARILLAIAPAYDDFDTQTSIQDALSDMLHLCALAEWDFAVMLDEDVAQAPKKLTPKEQLFVAEYLVSFNASAAYRKAGYKGKDAAAGGYEILRKPHIQAEVEAAKEARLEKLSLTADDIVAKLELIATADPTKLTAHHIGACRYCWGIEHRHQWRTPREYTEAVEMHMLKGEAYRANHPEPDNEGGYGYRQTVRPNPDCPECEGLGKPYVVFADTRDMGPAERELFLGVKQTQHGIENKMSDKAHALDQLAQRTGVFAKRDENMANALVQAIAEIQERTSRAPINSGTR